MERLSFAVVASLLEPQLGRLMAQAIELGEQHQAHYTTKLYTVALSPTVSLTILRIGDDQLILESIDIVQLHRLWSLTNCSLSRSNQENGGSHRTTATFWTAFDLPRDDVDPEELRHRQSNISVYLKRGQAYANSFRDIDSEIIDYDEVVDRLLRWAGIENFLMAQVA